jgi:hypothetical protein
VAHPQSKNCLRTAIYPISEAWPLLNCSLRAGRKTLHLLALSAARAHAKRKNPYKNFNRLGEWGNTACM